MGKIMDLLRNYDDLVSRVDDLCRRIETDYGGHLACRKGCDACCRHLSLFPVEAAALARALDGLSNEEAGEVRRRAGLSPVEGSCPLLREGACLMYRSRPVICRTHGLPLLAGDGGRRRLDWCPENFRGVKSLPNAAIIDLDVLNATLSAVNALFLSEAPEEVFSEKERFFISEALLLNLP